MTRHAWVPIALSLAFGCGHEAAPPARAPERVAAKPSVDVTAENLDPDTELDALLAGEAGVGTMRGVRRIAVPPFRVLGDSKRAWMGEAASELVADGLTKVDGVSVLERGALRTLIEELERAPNESSGEIAKRGRLLGATEVVLGKLIPIGDDRFRASVYSVRVEDGVRLEGTSFEVGANEWDRAAMPSVATLLSRMGMEKGAESSLPGLSPKKLERAARARRLQYAGKLLEAQPLYASALPEPTSAWGFERDYVSAMAELGMVEWSLDRISKLLARMPSKRELVCPRAELLVQRARRATSDTTLKPNARTKQTVAYSRDAVRAAASCGEPSVIASSLVAYAWAMENVHYPSARVAVERAAKLLGDDRGRNAYTRCVLTLELHRYASENGERVASDVAGYVQAAEACIAAGDFRVAAVAFGNAASRARDPAERLALRQRAVKMAKRVGGGELDRQTIWLADSLRQIGKISEADEHLTGLVSARLSAISRLYGGLPQAEAKLDSEFLARAKTPEMVSTRQPSGAAKLVAQAHRRGLAKLLNSWAARTRPDSTPQADEYEAIARELDPPLTDVWKSKGEENARARLAAAGTSLEELEKLGATPLRGEIPLGEVFGALESWFWQVWQKPAKLETEKRVAAQAKKVASWLESPRCGWRALRFVALAEADAGEIKPGLASIRAATRMAENTPSELFWLLNTEAALESKQDRKRTLAVAKRRVEVGRRSNVDDHLNAIYDLGYYAVDQDPGVVESSIHLLVGQARDLEKRKLYEPAAAALAKASLLRRVASRADGTLEGVELYRERARILDRAKDPLRSLMARADVVVETLNYLSQVYRGSADKNLAADPVVSQLVSEISAGVERLVAEHRERDAARVVLTLPVSATGMESLIGRTFGWVERLKDSAEYPWLIGKLHSARGRLTKDPDRQRQEFQQARKWFVESDDPAAAVLESAGILRAQTTDTGLFDALDECEKTPNAKSVDRANCYYFLGNALFSIPLPKVTNATRWANVAARGEKLLPTVDVEYSPQGRYQLRSTLAFVAARGRDLALVDRMHEEITRYYTVTAPDAYQYVTHLSRVARSLRDTNPRKALELYRLFDAANGASAYWKASEYSEVAGLAAIAGDAANEKYFLDTGREYAKSYPQWVIRYELYDVNALAIAKKWSRVAKRHRDARELVRKRWPTYAEMLSSLDLGEAVALALDKQPDKASRVLAPDVKAIRAALASSTPRRMPCYDTQVLEVAAGIEDARGHCALAADLRDDAQKSRALCQEPQCIAAPTGATFCDAKNVIEWKAKNQCKQRFDGELDFWGLE